MVKLNNLAFAVDKIKNCKKALVVAHEKPDGDAFGSALGLVEILRDNGVNADALIPDLIAVKFEDIAGDDYCKSLTIQEINTNYDLVIVLDSASSVRVAFGAGISIDMIEVDILNIDHHEDNSVEATWSYVDGEAAATSQLIYQLAKEAISWQISPRAATLLLVGIVTDTGSFRFENSSAAVLRAAADLRDCGGDWGAVMSAAFFSKPIKQQSFEAELLHSYAKITCEGRFYYASIPQELFTKYSFSMRDGEAVIDQLREIAGVVIAALVYPRDGVFKCSLRSKDEAFPVGPIARKFNGGGHKMAAGCSIQANSLEEATDKLLVVVNETLN